MTKIAVLSPVYNEEQFISETLESVMKYRGEYPIQQVVVDDLSADSTLQIATKCAENSNGRIVVLRNSKKGKNAAINLAYASADSEVYLFLAGDDRIVADAIEARVKPLIDRDAPAITRAAMLVFVDGADDDFVRTPAIGGGNKSGGALAMNRSFAKLVFPIPEELPNEDTWIDAVAVAFDVDTIDVDSEVIEVRLHSNNSWNRDGDFEYYSSALTKRNMAYLLAEERFASTRPRGFERLSALAGAERFRRERKTVRILLCRSLSLRERVHFAAGSSRFLFWLRGFLAGLRRVRWFSGWHSSSAR
jgi:glycosyltransferase involved in cell wall biosynthesis